MTFGGITTAVASPQPVYVDAVFGGISSEILFLRFIIGNVARRNSMCRDRANGPINLSVPVWTTPSIAYEPACLIGQVLTEVFTWVHQRFQPLFDYFSMIF